MKRLLVTVLVLGGCGGDSDAPSPDAPLATCPLVGGQHDQKLVLGDGVEDRSYFLYVPPGYHCDEPIGLLVDFHGTAGGDEPEIAYATDELIALADARRFIVARPRSRSKLVNGQTFFQWDINPGDLQRNQTFGKKLVADLEARFPIDHARVYASGFSSGSNMASQFLFDPASPFKGIAPIAGGHWMPVGLPSLALGPRMYLATGYRDYLWPTTKALVDAVHAAGLPDDRIFVRRSGGGHEIHGYYYEEAWSFFDDGTRPPSGGAIAAPWTRDSLDETADLNALAVDGGALVAVTTQHGRLWRQTGATWTMDREQAGADYVAACFAGTRGFVGGSYAAAVRGTTWTPVAVPDYGMLGAGWVNGVDCRDDGSTIVVGYWSAAITSDNGATWSRFSVSTGFGVDALMAAIATSPGGATVIAGDYYLGRAPAGATTATRMYTGTGWWNAVTALPGGRFWAVGDGGVIAMSSDDGRTWSLQHSGTTNDLFAVHFADAAHGAAVGRAGTILVTDDGGATWTPRPLGAALYLGAVHVDATQIWVAGEDGLIAHAPR